MDTNNKSEGPEHKGILEKTLLLSSLAAVLLTLLSSFIQEQSSCCVDCLCIAGPVTYRGFPFQFLTNSFRFYNDSLKGIFFNLLSYFTATFVIFFGIIKLLSKRKT